MLTSIEEHDGGNYTPFPEDLHARHAHISSDTDNLPLMWSPERTPRQTSLVLYIGGEL